MGNPMNRICILSASFSCGDSHQSLLHDRWCRLSFLARTATCDLRNLPSWQNESMWGISFRCTGTFSSDLCASARHGPSGSPPSCHIQAPCISSSFSSRSHSPCELSRATDLWKSFHSGNREGTWDCHGCKCCAFSSLPNSSGICCRNLQPHPCVWHSCGFWNPASLKTPFRTLHIWLSHSCACLFHVCASLSVTDTFDNRRSIPVASLFPPAGQSDVLSACVLSSMASTTKPSGRCCKDSDALSWSFYSAVSGHAFWCVCQCFVVHLCRNKWGHKICKPVNMINQISAIFSFSDKYNAVKCGWLQKLNTLAPSVDLRHIAFSQLRISLHFLCLWGLYDARMRKKVKTTQMYLSGPSSFGPVNSWPVEWLSRSCFHLKKSLVRLDSAAGLWWWCLWWYMYMT